MNFFSKFRRKILLADGTFEILEHEIDELMEKKKIIIKYF